LCPSVLSADSVEPAHGDGQGDQPAAPYAVG
jgi:hypothetical protein